MTHVSDSSDDEIQNLEGREALTAAALELASTALRDVAMLSHELEPPIYDNAEFADAIAQVARAGRGARVRLLIRRDEHLVRHGHALVHLAQQLSSYVEIRLVSRQFSHLTHGYLITDASGVFYQPLSDAFKARVSQNDRRWARDLLTEFERLWEHAEPDPQLRRLALGS